MKKYLLLIIFASTLYLVKAQTLTPICLSNKIDYPTYVAPYKVVTGDFNNDGFMDFASSIVSGCASSIYLGNGVGNFTYLSPDTSYSNCNSLLIPATAIKAGDIDNDGILDIITVINNTNSLNFQSGMGNGYFYPKLSISTGSNSSPFDLALGDFDKNTYLDFATANYNANNVSIVSTTSLGNYSLTATYSVGLGPIAIISSDFNNDGNLDIATANVYSNGISVLLGNNLGTFSPAMSFSSDLNPSALVSGDFNNDSNLDIAVSNYGSNNFSLLFGDGFGNFVLDSNYTVGGSPSSIKSADFNNDGFKDVIISIDNNNTINLFLNNGNGLFFSSEIKTTGSNPTDLAIAEFNGDFVPDIVTANNLGISNSVFFGGFVPLISVNSGTICGGTTFTLMPSGASTYTYSGGSAIVSPANTTTYSVIGTTTIGCVSSVAAICTVSVNTTPTVSVNSGSICTGNSFTINPAGANTYTISGGDAVVTPSANTSYTVNAMALNGCVDDAVLTITVNPNPTLVAGSSNSLTCEGQMAFLSVNGSANTFTWSTGSQFTIISITPTVTTNYTVSGTNSFGCISAVVVTQSVSNCTSINNLTNINNNDINVYPNPNNGIFTIETGVLSEFAIINNLGQTVELSNNQQQKHLMDILHLPNGIYFVKIKASNNKYSFYKIVKQ